MGPLSSQHDTYSSCGWMRLSAIFQTNTQQQQMAWSL